MLVCSRMQLLTNIVCSFLLCLGGRGGGGGGGGIGHDKESSIKVGYLSCI